MNNKSAKIGQHFLLYFAFSAFCFSLSASEIYAQGQRKSETPPVQLSQDQVLRSLLEEVRQLRLSLERTNFNVFRAQIIVERIRLQQEQLARLNQQFEELRGQAADNKLNQSHLQDRIKEIDSKISQERDPATRSQLESEQKEMKFLLEQQGVWEERQRERENQLNVQFQTEQEKLKRLNDRLDALEREIESRSTVSATP
jgi:chromosome segregation ATPase